MKKTMAVILSLTLAILLCACGGGTAPAPSTGAPAAPSSDTNTPADTGTSGEAATPATEDNTAETEELQVTLPKDNGMTGVYKWVEMEEKGITANLIIFDNGTGVFEIGDCSAFSACRRGREVSPTLLLLIYC